MKNILRLLFILSPSLLFAQADIATRDFSKVDAYAISVKNVSDLQALSNKLTASYPDTVDKVRAIFRWETENIAYDVAGLRNPDLYVGLAPKNETSQAKADKDFQLAVAKYVAGQRKAVCYGYANLFKTLCDYAGIQSVVIDGYGRSDFNTIGEPFKSNHSWNAVNIGGKWNLLDATWGAGSVNYAMSGFKKDFNAGYFLSTPENFILDHYPTDTKWTLLASAPSLEEFFNSPIIYPGFLSHKLHLTTPVNGVIEAKSGDKINFEIATDDSNPYFGVIDDASITRKTIPEEEMKAYTHPDPNNLKLITCTYEVKSKKVHDLFVIYSYESILRYKIKVKS